MKITWLELDSAHSGVIVYVTRHAGEKGYAARLPGIYQDLQAIHDRHTGLLGSLVQSDSEAIAYLQDVQRYLLSSGVPDSEGIAAAIASASGTQEVTIASEREAASGAIDATLGTVRDLGSAAGQAAETAAAASKAAQSVLSTTAGKVGVVAALLGLAYMFFARK